MVSSFCVRHPLAPLLPDTSVCCEKTIYHSSFKFLKVNPLTSTLVFTAPCAHLLKVAAASAGKFFELMRTREAHTSTFGVAISKLNASLITFRTTGSRRDPMMIRSVTVDGTYRSNRVTPTERWQTPGNICKFENNSPNLKPKAGHSYNLFSPGANHVKRAFHGFIHQAHSDLIKRSRR